MSTLDSVLPSPTPAPARGLAKAAPATATLFHEKLVTGEQALRAVNSGDFVYVHPGCACPERLLDALVARKDELTNVRIMHLMSLGRADYAQPGMERHFHHIALFTGKNVRQAINEGRADYIPVFLSEIPRLFTSGRVPVDVALIHVSPPDEHGFCSYGVGVDATKAAAEMARIVIAQVNPNMPRVLGDNFIHVRKVTYFVESNDPLVELPRVRMSPAFEDVGRNVASLIDDGATLQMGIGAIPDAVLHHVQDRNDRMVAVNSAIQVDLTGQVCADSIGDTVYSGFGGQVDFVRGASRAKGGKAIIALLSTAKDGEVSRINAYLDEGAGVVTSRADVHTIVTEFGVADLHGKTLRERARALIDIAHPKFRDELERGARKRRLF